jgi:hypothetical protein
MVAAYAAIVRAPGVLRVPGFVPALLVTGAAGAVVGGVDVIVPAQLAPDDTLAGILLGVEGLPVLVVSAVAAVVMLAGALVLGAMAMTAGKT